MEKPEHKTLKKPEILENEYALKKVLDFVRCSLFFSLRPRPSLLAHALPSTSSSFYP